MHLLRSATSAHLDDAEYAAAQEQAARHPKGSREFPATGNGAASRSTTATGCTTTSGARSCAASGPRSSSASTCSSARGLQPRLPARRKAATAGNAWCRSTAVRSLPRSRSSGPATRACAGCRPPVVPLGLSGEGLPVGARRSWACFATPWGLRFARWLETEYRAFQPPPMAA